MKKIFFLLAISLSTLSIAQQHEIKLDLFDALVLKTIDVAYEYQLNEEASIGFSAQFNFENKDANFRYDQNESFTPYFRHFFTTSQKWNFFGELFLGINSGEKRLINTTTNTPYYTPYTDGALGVGVGTKYKTEKGLVIDGYIGVGRNLFSSNSPIVFPRVGVNIGYAF